MSAAAFCKYCSRTVDGLERASLCDRCLAAHHESCWERNGRCSTFRCGGVPQTMLGSDISHTIAARAARANQAPTACPFCSSRVHAGSLSARGRLPEGGPMLRGLRFVCARNAQGGRARGGILRRVFGTAWWFVPQVQVRARSCGQCRRLFVAGLAVAPRKPVLPDEAGPREEWCPRCAAPMAIGHIALRPTEGGARFTCDEPPGFHKDWFGHHVLDRYVYNRWDVNARGLEAASCRVCRHTVVLGWPLTPLE